MRKETTQRLFTGYYAATAAFAALDYGFAVNVRLAFLDDHPGWRALYYLFCVACFLLIRRYPRWTNAIAALESLVTVSALIFTMALRVMIVTDDVLESGRSAVSVQEVVNFLISGGAAYIALLTRSSAAREDLRRL